MTRAYQVRPETFRRYLARAGAANPRVAEACSAPEELPEDARFYILAGRRAGFGIADGGELIGVWSTESGRGGDIMAAAHNAGARRLDCFDGFLPGFYARHGWHETGREPNWTPGGPDIVFMQRNQPNGGS